MMKAIPPSAYRPCQIRTAAARFPTSPTIEIAFGVSRDSIRRFRTAAESSPAVVGLAPGVGGPLLERSLCSTPIVSTRGLGGRGLRLRPTLDLWGPAPLAHRPEGPIR